ncbi:uncharacterized protein SPSK_02146 [Sporothrix schenckii 1099-18]|uniref:Serine-rich protein n=2 Tax=Sporothrix schenckii TaxID=29908 RepID=U7PQZ2_SPOS1|nr:uncharacterized protein SPSK_02146 [Sporothrix schenckii 1099-18]ERS97164.1 hypothetical protein HMPREF1624_06495 [Sporothrix schenckii ATCC 58251]KJR86381.1 hypothetical protein SPSK_02146 [Sporothrix schenckii 1099-18]
MSLRWTPPGIDGIDRPTSWHQAFGNQQPQYDSVSAAPETEACLPLNADDSNDTNGQNGRKLPIRTMSAFSAHQQLDRERQRDWSGRRATPTPLPLHERSASESNRMTDIRVVPYSPPRLDSAPQEVQSGLQLPGPVSGSPSSSPRRRRRQRQRRRRSKDHDNNDSDSNGGEDSDQTTTTSRRFSRPTSWASRGSWGPSTALAGAGASPSASTSASPAPGSPGSKASSSRTVVSGQSGKPAKAGTGKTGKAGHSVLSEKSRNSVMGAKWANVTRSGNGNDGKPLDKEGYASSGPGSALSSPVETATPLARAGRRGVSGSKLTSPTGSQFTAATTTTFSGATSDTPATAANTTKNTSNSSTITDVNATSRLLAHKPRPQPQLQLQRHQQHQLQQGIHDFSLGDDAPSARSGAQLGLTPASASFSAAAASHLTEHRSASGAPQLQLPDPPSSPIAFPTSPSSSSTFFLPSSYHQPLSITTSNTASSTITGPSLSPTPSVASLTSASSSQAAPRPNSRRRNLVAVHADKTFSLVPRNSSGKTGAGTSPAFPSGLLVRPDLPPPTPAATTISSLKSPPLSFVTSTVRSSSSHERLSSDVFSGDDHPSSPLTTTSATLQDRSSLSPVTLSPGSSTVHLHEDPIVSADPSLFPLPASATGVSNNTSPWNYRLAGGLRKVPKTPDFRHKGKGRAVPSTPTDSPYSHRHHPVISGLDVSILPPLSESTSSPTTTVVAGGSTAIGSTTRIASSSTYTTATLRPQRKTSFASDQSAGALSTDSSLSLSASTISAATNYKVYAHSSSPAGAAANSTALESTDSFESHPSSHSTNIEILGVSSPAAPPLPALQRSDDPDETFASLASYPSIASFDTGISESSAPNFVVLGASSPPAPSRYLDRIRNGFTPDVDVPSSPPLPPRSATTTTDTLDTSDSDPNYVLHGEPSTISFPPPSSSSNSSSLVTISRQPRPVYSQESLIVPPLKTVKAKKSNERFGYYKSRSRESLRRAASIKSISSLFGQEAASTFFAGQAFLNIDIPPIPVFTGSKAAAAAALKQQHQLPGFAKTPSLPTVKRKPLPLPAPTVQSENYVVYDRTPNKKSGPASLDSWDSPSSSQLTSSPQSPTLPQQPISKRSKLATVQMVEEHPHQWSSQLSTVMSESEGDSLRASSRSVSVMSGAPSGSYIRGDVSAVSGASVRRSSTGWASSTHSRNMPSISSSLGLQMDELRDRNSRSDSLLLDRPNPAFFRANSASPTTSGSGAPYPPPIRTVRDHDEHGDGLADLHDVGRQPSRSGLSGFFSSSNNSARNLHSSGSMRSIASGGFPSWARVYYGSGEHRALSVEPSMSELGQGDDYMAGVGRPNSAFRRSPSLDNMHFNIFNTRRRPREVQPTGPRPFSDAASMEAGEAGVVNDYRLRPPGLRKMTSSIWSPHLRVDRRATRFSVWEPPSVTWSTDTTSTFDRRNLHVVCFTIGFVFPLAWMAAAFLPLPPDPKRAMEKRAEGKYGVPEALKRRIAQYDEARYQSAKWWRTLNRVMSVFGLLILGAVAALVVVGVRQGWGQ